MVTLKTLRREQVVDWMRGGIWVAALVGGLSIGLVGCEGAAQGASCATVRGVAVKLTALTDDLNKAQSRGKLDALAAGEIGARIMAAGAKFEGDGDQLAYCKAIDKIRHDAGL
jgi:hypothetical protein